LRAPVRFAYRDFEVLIAIVLLIIGFLIGRNAKVILVIPVAILCTIVFFTIWYTQNQLDWFKLAIWFGYMAALETGYLCGAATVGANRK